MISNVKKSARVRSVYYAIALVALAAMALPAQIALAGAQPGPTP